MLTNNIRKSRRAERPHCITFLPYNGATLDYIFNNTCANFQLHKKLITCTMDQRCESTLSHYSIFDQFGFSLSIFETGNFKR